VRNFGLYLSAIFEQWAFWFGLALAVVELIKSWVWLKKFAPVKRLLQLTWAVWGLAGIMLFWATFQAWQQEHVRRKGEEVYLVEENPHFFVHSQQNPVRIPVGDPLKMAPYWKTFGNLPALNVRLQSACYIEDGYTNEYQKSAIDDFKEFWASQETLVHSKENATLFPGPDQTFYKMCKPSEQVITEEIRNDLLYGRKFAFVVGAARFSDSAGEHEARFCKWIENTVNDSGDFGSVSFHDCDTYTTQVDISDP
jgi:hypothetical protein